jgi:hypothetical protein
MAIGTLSLGSIAAPGAEPPVFLDLVSFAGDGAYPTGGTAAFQTTFRTKVKSAREILAVIPQDCGGYVPCYDKTNDKLKVYFANNDGGADGPLIEVTSAADLSAITFNVLVVSR